jgi:hypothetical protein
MIGGRKMIMVWYGSVMEMMMFCGRRRKRDGFEERKWLRSHCVVVAILLFSFLVYEFVSLCVERFVWNPNFFSSFLCESFLLL